MNSLYFLQRRLLSLLVLSLVLCSHDALASPPPSNNDPFITPWPVPSSGIAYPAGHCYTQSLVGTTAGLVGFTANVLPGAGQDRWYSFVATSNGCRIATSSTVVDVVIEIRLGGVLIDFENVVIGPGNEILSTASLIEGFTYNVGVRSYDGVLGDYSVCIQTLEDSYCDDPSGTYSLCANLKAKWTGANSYDVYFTPQPGTPGNFTMYTTTSHVPLSNSGLNLIHGGSYDVIINTHYLLANGQGDIELIEVYSNQMASITIAPPPSIEVKVGQRCPAVLYGGSVIQGKPYNCGATNYTVKFTPVSDCSGTTTTGSAVTSNTLGSSAHLSLSGLVPNQLVPNGHYRVEWQPHFSYGSGTYGNPQVIYIAGANMEEEDFEPNPMELRTVKTPDAIIYPNPNKGQTIHLNLSESTEHEFTDVKIIDNTGRLVQAYQLNTRNSTQHALRLDEELSEGFYMIKVDNGKDVITERIIVVH